MHSEQCSGFLWQRNSKLEVISLQRCILHSRCLAIDQPVKSDMLTVIVHPPCFCLSACPSAIPLKPINFTIYITANFIVKTAYKTITICLLQPLSIRRTSTNPRGFVPGIKEESVCRLTAAKPRVMYFIYRFVCVKFLLCYKSEGRWFDSRWCHWNFSLT